VKLLYARHTVAYTEVYLDEVINSQFNCMNWPSEIRHCISIFSFFMKNDQLRHLAQTHASINNTDHLQQYTAVLLTICNLALCMTLLNKCTSTIIFLNKYRISQVNASVVKHINVKLTTSHKNAHKTNTSRVQWRKMH